MTRVATARPVRSTIERHALDAVVEGLSPAVGPVKRVRVRASYGRAEWEALPLVGGQDDGVERLELRQCACTSTIAIVVGPSFKL
jgi:hypothetical protein